MDNKLIITIIFTIISSGIVAPFSKSIFDKIFVAYNPDPKKITSGIKKILIFTFRYLLPIANLVFVLIFFKTVDKLFVLIVSFVIASLLFNLLFDMLFSFITKVYLSDSNIIDRIITVIEKQQAGNVDAFKKLAEIHKDHLKITTQLAEKNKDDNKE